MNKTFTIVIAIAVFAACSGKEQVANQPATSTATPAPTTQSAAAMPAMPAGHPPISGTDTKSTAIPQMGGAVIEKTDKKQVAGTVLETLEGGGFTYARLRTAAGDEWFVLGPANVKKGDKVTVQVKMTAEKFASKSLNRTFDKITFADLASGAPAGINKENMAATHAVAAAGPGDVGPIAVPRAEGGKTVSELWGQRALLGDSTVTVRGKVVKSMAGIMGKNWIHLRDGSGTRELGDDDITVTTTAEVKVGETVTVTGVLRTDKDFGAGYKYAAIIEDAKIR